MPYFKASVQYGDWHGTAAADESDDDKKFDELFTATGQVDPKTEIMVGYSFYSGEGFVSLTGYVHRKPADSNKGWFPSLNQQFQQDPNAIDLKPVRVDLTLEKFFSHFKRFDVTMMRQGIEMTGREYRETE